MTTSALKHASIRRFNDTLKGRTGLFFSFLHDFEDILKITLFKLYYFSTLVFNYLMYYFII